MKKFAIFGLLILLAGGGFWYFWSQNYGYDSAKVSEQLKQDVVHLQGTTVSISKRDKDFYVFHSSDGYGSIVGIAKLEDGRFKEVLTFQETPQCSRVPQEVPVSLMESCYEGNELRSR